MGFLVVAVPRSNVSGAVTDHRARNRLDVVPPIAGVFLWCALALRIAAGLSIIHPTYLGVRS